MNHIGNANKMVSETPISDSTPHNVADLGMLCRTLERKLAAATSEIERLTAKVAQLYAGAEEQNQRIKQLDDRIHRAASAFFRDGSDGHVASQMLQILEEERNKP